MKAKTLFTLALLAFTSVLIAESLTLSPASRAAPLWVLVPTAMLLVVRLMPRFFPRPGRPGADRGRAGPEGRYDARSVGGPAGSREGPMPPLDARSVGAAGPDGSYDARFVGGPTGSRVGRTRSYDARSVGGPAWSRRDRPSRRGARITGWLLLLLALIDALGFFVAVPLFVAPYLRVEGGLRWRGALLFAAVLVGALYLVFGLWVEVRFPDARLVGLAAGMR